MKADIESGYAEALEFWNKNFALTEEVRADCREKAIPGSDGKNLAYSDELAGLICAELAGRQRVLDYGCGRGWAGICLALAGCKDVTCADVSENAVEAVRYLRQLLGMDKGFRALHIAQDWLAGEPADSFDGITSTNVLDVIPESVSREIIREMARVVTPEGKVVIAMNYYMEPVDNPEKNIVIRNGNHVYMNGILRMVTFTDDEWTEIFSEYFNVEKLTHYAWNGEERKRRRFFVLGRKR